MNWILVKLKEGDMEERCMRCDCTKNEHQIYHFESGCWCTKCIDEVMSAERCGVRVEG